MRQDSIYFVYRILLREINFTYKSLDEKYVQTLECPNTFILCLVSIFFSQGHYLRQKTWTYDIRLMQKLNTAVPAMFVEAK